MRSHIVMDYCPGGQHACELSFYCAVVLVLVMFSALDALSDIYPCPGLIPSVISFVCLYRRGVLQSL